MTDEVTAVSGGANQTDEDEKENQQITALLKSYNGARGFDKGARKNYARDRKYAAGTANPSWAVDANMIGTFIDILVSFLYAKDPEINAVPGEQADKQPGEDEQNFADTIRLVVSRLWRDGRLKRVVRKQVRSSLSVGPGWLKVIMRATQTKNDPIVQKDLNDLQDNVARLRATKTEIENESGEKDEEEINVLIAEKEQLMASLETKLEVVIRRGLAIDFVRAEDMQVSLDVSELSDYLDANWLGNQMFIEKSEVLMMFDRLEEEDITLAKVFYQRQDQTDVDAAKTIEDVTSRDAEKYTTAPPAEAGDESSVEFVRIVEIWDKRDNHIKTVIDGVRKWARKPYEPQFASSRFYPYFNLSLFEVDGERHPQSLSGRLDKLQDEYASTRSSGRLARSRSITGVIFDAGKITADDVRKIEQAVEQEYTGINPVAGDDLAKAFTAKPVGRYDARIYDTSPILQDMERIGGVQEALSQATTVDKTATEANIQDKGFQSRTGADRDTIEDMLTDLAQYTTELSIQALSAEQVQRIAGPLAFWPEEMDIEDIATMVQVEIEAGTTGKPNRAQEQQAWSTLLPLIRETMVLIQQAFAQGNEPLAEALTELLQETAKRLDDRVNLKKFLPKLEATPKGAIPAEGAGGPTPNPATAGAPGGGPTGAPV